MTNINSIKEAFNKNRVEAEKETVTPEELAVPINLLGNDKGKKYLTNLVNRVAKSELGKKTLEDAAKAGYSIDLATIPGSFGGCDNNQKIIFLNPSFEEDRLLLTLAHEARHAAQFERKSFPDFEHDTMKSQIMIARAMEADAQRAACVTGWELSQKGDEAPYKHFSNDEPCIAQAFEKAINKNATIEEASTAAFKGWYDNNHIKDLYEDMYIIKQLGGITQQGLDGQMKFNNNYSGKDIVEKMCFTEDGKNYFTDNPEVLEQGKFVDIKPESKNFLEQFMDNRRRMFGLEPDKTLEELPIRGANANIDKRQRLAVNRISAIKAKKTAEAMIISKTASLSCR